MDRVTLSITPENVITIGIMAILSWLVAGTVWQVAKKYVPRIGGGSDDGDAEGNY